METIDQIQRRLGDLKRQQKAVVNGSTQYWQLNSLMKAERAKLGPAYAIPAKAETNAKLQIDREAEVEDDQRSSHTPFHFYAIPGSQQAAVLVDRIYAQWLQFHPFKRAQSGERLQEYRQIIEGVVSNILYALAMQRPGVYVTREQSTLAKASRYRPGVYNQKLLTVLDDLHEMKVLEQIKGERWKKDYAAEFGFQVKARSGGDQGFFNRTQLQTTPALEDLRATYQTIRPTDVLFRTEGQEVVIVRKDESSALMEYTDEEKPKAVKYRKQMKVIDRMLADAGSLLAPEYEDDPTIDQRQRFLVRKFTYGETTEAGKNLESGGRLWGGFWQNMPKVERPTRLRINGQHTVELDFTSIIGHLAYIVAEEDTPEGDLWDLPGMSPESRPGIKKLIPALMFKDTLATRFPKGVKERFAAEDQMKSFGHVLELVKARHPGIVHLFGTGIGHYLQFLESKLMVNVLLHCKWEKIVALPIHDCIIVAKDQEEKGRKIMEKACWMVLRRIIPVKKH